MSGHPIRRKLVPGRTSDPVNPDIEREARRIFKDPQYRAASEHVISQLSTGHFAEIARAADMKLCGRRPAAIIVKDNAATGYFTARCHQRLCPYCQALNAAEQRMRLLPVVEELWAVDKQLSVLTVSIPLEHGDSPPFAFRLLDNALHVFTRSTPFKSCVSGWARGMEVPHVSDGFFPFARFLVEGELWQVAGLLHCWADSVRLAGGPEPTPQSVNCGELSVAPCSILHQVLACPFKPEDLATADLAALRDLQLGMRWRHPIEFCLSWRRCAGELHEEAQRSAQLEDEAEGVRQIGFYKLMQQSQRLDAKAILLSLREILEGDDDFREVVAMLRSGSKAGLL
ncbi:MAG: hypothetical protein IT462_05380 [Planctomycetes bacterium]|nr:hypothetical protein [Planctomycetota bacterium]